MDRRKKSYSEKYWLASSKISPAVETAGLNVMVLIKLLLILNSIAFIY